MHEGSDEEIYGGYSTDFVDEVYVEDPPSLPADTLSPIKNNMTNSDENYADEYKNDFAVEGSVVKEGSQVSFKFPDGEGEGSQVSFGRPNALLNSVADEEFHSQSYLDMGDANLYHRFHNSRGGMSTSVSTTKIVTVTTQCDILCTTNTVINYVIEKVAHPMHDTVGVLPYKGRRDNRLTHWKKGETPWQRLKMNEAKVSRNDILKDEREHFLVRLKYEQEERTDLRNFFASRIQALFRGVQSRAHKLEKRRMKPIPYIPHKKAVFRVIQSQIQDELCTFANILNLAPIPGLCLIPRSKASKRMKKIQMAAALRMQKFFKMLVARALACRRLDHLRWVRIHGAARYVSRFFKSLKMRTFAHRCRVEKNERAVRKLQAAARKFISAHRVRVLRRNMVRYRQMTNAARIVQRNMKRIFWDKAKKLIMVYAKAELQVLQEAVDAYVQQGVAEVEAILQEEFVLEAATEKLINEVLKEAVDGEEEAFIAIHLQKMEEEMRLREKERQELEQELLRREQTEQAEQLERKKQKEREKEEEREREREREREEEREKEREREREEEREKEREREKEKAAQAAQQKHVQVAVLDSNIIESPAVSPVKQLATQFSRESISTVLASASFGADKENKSNVSTSSTKEVGSSVAVESPTCAFSPLPKTSVQEAAAELSSFYVSEALVKSRPSSPVLDLARTEIAGVLQTATSKLSTPTSSAKITATKSVDSAAASAVASVDDQSVAQPQVLVLREAPVEVFDLKSPKDIDEAWEYLLTAADMIQRCDFNKAQASLDNIKASVEEVSGGSSQNINFLLSQIELGMAGICLGRHNYPQAQHHYDQAAQLSVGIVADNGHPLVAEARNGVAVCQWRQGNYADAFTSFAALVADQTPQTTKWVDAEGMDAVFNAYIAQASCSADRTLSQARTCIDIARLHFTNGKYREVQEYTAAAKKMLESSEIIQEHTHYAAVKAKLFSVLADYENQLCSASTQSDSVETLLLLKRNMYEADLSEDNTEEHDRHPAMVSTMLRAVREQLQQSDLMDIDYFMQRCIETRQLSAASNPTAMANTWHVAAMVQRAQGKFSAAIETAERVLQMRRDMLGARHVLVAETLHLLGDIKLDLLLPNEGKVYLDESVSILKEKFPEADHMAVLEVLLSCGRCHKIQGNYEFALELFFSSKETLQATISEFALGPHVLSIVIDMEIAETFLELGQSDECMRIIANAGKDLTRLVGDKHVYVSNALLLLSRAFMAETKFAKADTVLKRAMAVRTGALGAGHPLLGEIYHCMAENQRLRGYFVTAAKYTAIAMQLCTTGFPANGPRAAMSKFYKAQLARDCGNFDEAVPLYETALQVVGESLSATSWQYAQIMGASGECFGLMGDYDKATATIQTAIEVVQKSYGKDNLRNVELLRSYAIICIYTADAGKISQARSILDESVLRLQEDFLPENHPSLMFSHALSGVCTKLTETPRTERSAEDVDLELTTPQDLIDDALDVFDKVLKFSRDHPWVKMLGGFLGASSVGGSHAHNIATGSESVLPEGSLLFAGSSIDIGGGQDDTTIGDLVEPIPGGV